MPSQISQNILCAILFSGNGSNMQNLIESLHKRRFYHLYSKQEVQLHIALTLCNNKNAYGITRAKSLNIPCEILSHRDFPSREAFDSAMVDILQSHHIDYVFLAGFMRILTPVFTQHIRAINIHPSFLPAFKGAHAIRDSFYASVNYGGVSVHWVSDELDSGSIIAQEKVPKYQSDSLEDFESRIHECEYRLYPRAICEALGLDSISLESL